MFDYALLLAFPLAQDYLDQLEKVPPALKALFIQEDHSDYLCHLQHEQQTFLAKRLGGNVNMQALELAYVHMQSILKRLVPDFPYAEHPLVLFAVKV